MHYKKDELTLLYNSANPRDIKTLAYAKTITTKINKQDVNSVTVSATLSKVMVDKLGGDPKVLINKSLRYYQQQLRGHDYKPKMWLLAIKKMPELLTAPVALYRNRVVVCNSPTDILKVLNAPATA
jgi:arsenate reductase